MIDGVVRSLEPRSDIVRLLCQKDALTTVLRMEWRCARQKQQGDHLSETTAASPANSSGDWDQGSHVGLEHGQYLPCFES